jgi:hypothetical protein
MAMKSNFSRSPDRDLNIGLLEYNKVRALPTRLHHLVEVSFELHFPSEKQLLMPARQIVSRNEFSCDKTCVCDDTGLA